MRINRLPRHTRLRFIPTAGLCVDDPAAGGGGAGDDGGQGGDDGKITLTQKELNDRESRVRRTTEHQAQVTQAKELGFDTVDAMKAALAAHKANEDKTLSDAEKARRDADQLKRDAEADRAEAANERLQVSVQGALQLAGVNGKRLANVAKLVEVQAGATAEDITAAVEALKKDMPELFAASTDGGGGNQDLGGGGTPPKDRKKPEGAVGAGGLAQLARRGIKVGEGAKV